MSTSKREFDTVTLELFTVRDRLHRGGVLVQEINLLERQSLGLKNGRELLGKYRKRINKD